MIRRPAPAKINLTLRVTARRSDGYHELASLVAFADAADHLCASPASRLSLRIDGPCGASLQGDDDNLVLQAARALRRTYDLEAGAAITLHKVLPVASGIGGGSADAAATIRMLCGLWGIDADDTGLDEIALSLGADVPVCLTGRPAWVTGIGDRVAPLHAFPSLEAVLVNPGVPVATAQVFAALPNPGSVHAVAMPPPSPNGEELIAWLTEQRNDLQAPALSIEPRIGDALAALENCNGCRLARMSGSGATVFGIFDRHALARAAAAHLERDQKGWWVRKVTIGGTDA